MSCADVLVKRSSLERAVAYAYKINDLSMYDCGLGEWIQATKQKGKQPSQRRRPHHSQSLTRAHQPTREPPVASRRQAQRGRL